MNSKYAVARGNIIKDGNDFLFPLRFGRGLARINDLTDNCDIVATFYDEPLNISGHYMYALKDESKIILAPRNNDHISIVDLNNNSIKKIHLSETPGGIADWKKDRAKFTGIIKVGRTAVFPGQCYPAVVCMDMDTFELRYITRWSNDFINSCDEFSYFSSGAVVIGEQHIVLSAFNTPMAVKIDVNTEETSIMRLDVPLIKIHNIAFNEGEVYVTGWGKHTEECYFTDSIFSFWEKIELPDDELPDGLKGTFVYSEPIFFEDEVYLIPVMGRNAYRIDRKTHQAEACYELNQVIVNNRNGQSYYRIAQIVRDNNIIFSFSGSENWYCYDVKSRTIEEKNILLPNSFLRHERTALMQKELEETGCIYEGEGDLELFISRFSEATDEE